MLAVLLLAAGALGFLRPRRAWLTGLLLGSCLALAHLLQTLTGLVPPAYQTAAPTALAALALAVLVVPGLLAALAGAALRRFTR